jgi:signal transduction histidine kinase
MSSSEPTRRGPHEDAKPRAVVSVGPYLLLAVLVVVTTAVKHDAGASLAVDLALCALAALWMLWMVTLHPAWRERPRTMAVFLAGLVAIMMVLVVRDPWFGFFSPAGYVYAFTLIRWPWRLLAVGSVAVVAGTAQTYGESKTTLIGLTVYGAVLIANVVPMCGFAVIDWKSDEQKAQRELALAQVSEAKRQLEVTLAENAGLHEQLLRQAREAGVQDERQRMAREIHDTLAQGLTGIIAQLRAAEQAGDDPPGWRRHIDAATGLARDSLTEARRSVHALRPEPLETARLSDALEKVAARWTALNGLAVEVATTGEARPMKADVEVALLRTAQEALANVAKHAQATRVALTLSYMENEVALDVRDDGRGFDPDRLGAGGVPDDEGAAAAVAAGTSGGFGLTAMRQRIEGLAGTLQIESEPGGGTGISACVPFAPVEVRA